MPRRGFTLIELLLVIAIIARSINFAVYQALGPAAKSLASISPDYSWHIPSRDRKGVDSNHLTTP